MLDRFLAALAPFLIGAIERIADKKIPDDTVPNLVQGLLAIVQSTADRIAGSVESELVQLGKEVRDVVEAANPLDIIGKLFRR